MPRSDSNYNAIRRLVNRGVRNASNIAKRLGISVRTVQRCLAQLRAEGSTIAFSKRGPAPSFASISSRTLSRLLHAEPSHTIADLRHYFVNKKSMNVSRATLHRRLHASGYNWRQPTFISLTPAHRAARVAFAREHLDDSWASTWAFDESYFNLQPHRQYRWVRSTASHPETLPPPSHLCRWASLLQFPAHENHRLLSSTATGAPMISSLFSLPLSCRP